MTISKQELLDLEADINDILDEDCAEVRFTFHAAYDRLNHARNNPPITLDELEAVFTEFIRTHLQAVLTYAEGTMFTIKCNKTHLNFPCAIVHDRRIGKVWVVQQVLTVMRKEKFVAKDPLVLQIN
ncbi:hypothetical protein [Enterobacter sp.]|uniref:hypothetical protein n=1 Tax=Enterobacter sp. TaxID=42895 RepID=UPI00296F392F|nr:hypothetical protein [Enterobacter sp.]